MGKGSPSPPPQQPTTSRVTQTSSNLPEYAEPYFTRLLDRTEVQTQLPYEAFGQERIAQPTASGTSSEEMVSSIANDPSTAASFDVASGEFLDQLARPTQFTGTNLAAQYNPATAFAQYAAPTEAVLASTDPRTNVQSFINPYLESVLAQQEASAQRRFTEAQAGRDAAAVQGGAFGGSRRAVADSLAQRDLNERLDQMGAQARQSGFDRAMAAATGQQELAVKTRAQALADAAGQQQRMLQAA